MRGTGTRETELTIFQHTLRVNLLAIKLYDNGNAQAFTNDNYRVQTSIFKTQFLPTMQGCMTTCDSDLKFYCEQAG